MEHNDRCGLPFCPRRGERLVPIPESRNLCYLTLTADGHFSRYFCDRRIRRAHRLGVVDKDPAREAGVQVLNTFPAKITLKPAPRNQRDHAHEEGRADDGPHDWEVGRADAYRKEFRQPHRSS